MPKKHPPKMSVVFNADPLVAEYVKRQHVYSNPIEGFIDKGGHCWVTRRSLEAFERRRLAEELPTIEQLDRMAAEQEEERIAREAAEKPADTASGSHE